MLQIQNHIYILRFKVQITKDRDSHDSLALAIRQNALTPSGLTHGAFTY